MILSDTQKKFLLLLARISVESRLNGDNPEDIELSDPLMQQCVPAFVTIYKDNLLKGSMGLLHNLQIPLWKAVRQSAVSAALEDPRYPSIRIYEIPELCFEISLLSRFMMLSSVDEFQQEKGLYLNHATGSAVILPQIAAHHKWSVEDTLSEACLRADLPATYWKEHSLNLYSFDVLSFSDEK